MVGSSKSKRSGWANRTPAKATLIRQPPEKSEQGLVWASLSKPKPLRMDEARPSADQASISVRRVWISEIRAASVAVRDSASKAVLSVSASSTVSKSEVDDDGTSCATPPIFARAGKAISPPSSASSPLIRRKRVVLPVPLRPTRPTLWPVGIVAEAPTKSGRPSTEYEISEMRNIGTPCPIWQAASIPLASLRPLSGIFVQDQGLFKRRCIC